MHVQGKHGYHKMCCVKFDKDRPTHLNHDNSMEFEL